MNNLLLIHPPVSKPCEPPAGIARLAGALREHGISCTVIDANVEGLHFLLDSQRVREGADIWGHDPISSEIGIVSPDMKMVLKARGRDRAGNTWTKRAVHNLLRHLHSLRTWPLYGHADRYRRAVADINRVLAGASSRVSVTVGLADYEDAALSSLKSADLLQAAAHPEKNPFYPYFSERLAAILNDQDPELIGISVNYLSQALCAFAMIGFLRSLLPQGKIVLGGGLVTSWLRQNQRHNPCAGNLADVMTDSGADLLLHPQWQGCFAGLVDHLVAGPGEEVLLSLIKKDSHQTPSDGDSKDLSHSDFAVLSGSSISNVPCPDYRPFPWELYLSPGPILPYSASTGCYWRRCRFCPETAEGNPYRPLPVKKVLSDLERLKKETNPVLIHFLDNAVSPALLAALAEQRNRVPWYGFVRITEQMANPAFCRRLHDAGCVMLKLGLESGDQGVLDALEKGIDLKTASLVLRNLKEAGIGTYVYLLFGTPAEDRTAARRTMEYVVENSSSIDFLNVAIFNMPVFAAAADDLVTRPFSTGDLSLYTDFEHPQGWNRREVRSFVDGELKRNPVIAEILKRTPPVFTSNHAPLTLPSRVFLPLHC